MLIICICILNDPKLIIININKPFKNIDKFDIDIKYMPFENSNNPSIRLLIIFEKGRILDKSDNNIEKNNMFENIIESELITDLKDE